MNLVAMKLLCKCLSSVHAAFFLILCTVSYNCKPCRLRRQRTSSTLRPSPASRLRQALPPPAAGASSARDPQIHTHTPDQDACPDCGGKLRELGEDAAEMLGYVRASFKVIGHVHPKLGCVVCERIVQAPAPSRPIDRIAGPGLLAHVLVSKYADHQPLYGQSEIYARKDIDPDRSKLADASVLRAISWHL